MNVTTRFTITVATLLVAAGGCTAAPLDAARDRFASACADDLSRLCSVRHLGGDEAEVTCAPIGASTASPACVAAHEALAATRRR